MFKDGRILMADGRVAYAVLSRSNEGLLTVVKNGTTQIVLTSLGFKPDAQARRVEGVTSVATLSGMYIQKEEVLYEQN